MYAQIFQLYSWSARLTTKWENFDLLVDKFIETRCVSLKDNSNCQSRNFSTNDSLVFHFEQLRIQGHELPDLDC